MREASKWTIWLKLALEPRTIRRGLAYAAVVGAILVTINHFELLIGEAELTPSRLVKIALTVVVPYLVSTFSSVGAQLAHERTEP